MNICFIVDNKFNIRYNNIFPETSIFYSLFNNRFLVKNYNCKKIEIDELHNMIIQGTIHVLFVNDAKFIQIVENYINNSHSTLILFSNLNFKITNVNCTYIKSLKQHINQHINQHVNQHINQHINQKIMKVNTRSETKVKTRHETLGFVKLQFRNLCLNYLDKIRKINIPNIHLGNANEAIYIECRELPHSEVLIRNCILKLGNTWSYTVICHPDSYIYYQQMCSKIHPNIKVIKLLQTISSQNDYNNLLLTKEFWNLMNGEKVLIYQEDSLIFKDNIQDFLKWDYIGAPFKLETINGINVGNGGLSLRSRSKMIQVLDEVLLNFETLNSNCLYELLTNTVKSYMNIYKLDNIPEDILFSLGLQHFNIGIVADVETAKLFSSEQIFCDKSFGMHAMWYCCPSWKKYIICNFDTYFSLESNINDTNTGTNTKENQLDNLCSADKNKNSICVRYDMSYFKKIYINDIFNKELNFTKIKTTDSNTSSNSFIYEENVLITKHYNKLDFSPELINLNYINDIIDNFILLVDFSNKGGGTTKFINLIVSHYKMFKIFLIVRNYNGNIKFTINDEYEINEGFDEYSANDFLTKNNDKIEKIFINHTLGHTYNFLNNIVKLKKEITTITHDFYNINDIPNQYIHNITNNYLNSKTININDYNKIITQNVKNLLIFNEHITDKNKEIVVSNLPDYKESDEKIFTNNNNIVIGIFGAISDIKGKNILHDLIEYYKGRNNVEIIVFGLCHIKSFEKQYIYHNVKELNTLLKRFKPNILIELSIWPETYSYTLSLKMITDLPILYFKKTGNFVVEERLSHYGKAYSFQSFDEFDELIHLHKQNYFYTIKPIIYFNEFWDEYFAYNNNNKNVVLITSKIIVSSKKFSYINKRSIYTSEERLEQTLNTIKSIKKYIPNPYIILFDNSVMNETFNKMLNENVDKFINLINDEIINFYTNDCMYKAYGEISQLSVLVNELKNLNFEINNIFKISGRYTINNTFKYSIYNNNKNIFKLNNDVDDRMYFYTSFYKIKKREEFINIIEKLFNSIKNTNTYDNMDLEVFLPPEFSNKYLINNLGITENIAVWKQIKNI